MVDDQQFVLSLNQTLKDHITTLQPIGVPYSSNRVYRLETASGQCYIVKQPKGVREAVSPFWQHMDAIFGINRVTQSQTLPSICALLRQQALIPVPQVIDVQPASEAITDGTGVPSGPEQVPVDEPYAIVTYLGGTAYEPDAFPASTELHYQLGQYLGYLHTQHYPGYGNMLTEPLQPKAAFLETIMGSMRRTIKTFWNDQPALHNQLDTLAGTTNPEAIFSTANLIMVDISANQFVYHNNLISGVVDLDAYVIGPREFELAILEMCLTEPAAFQQGYECHTALPAFAPFRTFYRLWSYLNEPDHGYDATQFVEFMNQAVYFA